MQDVLNAVVIALLAVLYMVIVIILNAWALMTLWAWYVVPIFALPVLPFGGAAAIALMVRFLTHRVQKTSKSEDGEIDPKKAMTRPLAPALTPIFAVAFGWLYLQLWPL